MKKKRILFLSSLFLFSSLSADPEYQVIGDINFSAYSGAEDIITFQHGLVVGVDKLVGRPPTRRSVKDGFGRFFEILAWDVTNVYLAVVQHEIFGHGYRIRDLGTEYAKVKGYSFSWDGAATHFSITDRMTTSLESTISSGGVEATAILANRLRLKWLESGKIDGRESALYSFSQQDITDYVLSIDKGPILPEENGHDINSYLYLLHATYPNGKLTKGQLKARVLINYLDPFTYFSYYAQGKFVVNGRPMNIPMIPIGDYKYLPSVRLGLTPFGPEYFLENFLVKNQNPIYFYVKWGSFANNNYYGFGVEQPHLLSYKGWKLGYRFDAWRQPYILFDKGLLSNLSSESSYDFCGGGFIQETPGSTPSEHDLHKKRIGVAMSVCIEKQIAESAFSTYFQPGFKTAGFLPGQALRAAPIIFGGVSIKF